MEEVLMLLPTIFAFWAGILISWSCVVLGGLARIIYIIKYHNLTIRKSDVSAIVTTAIGGAVFVIALFVKPETTTLIVDAMIIASFWYTLILGYITGANLSGLPALLYGISPRK